VAWLFLVQAPEVFIGNYGLEADIWAAGMMMYQLLVSHAAAAALSSIITFSYHHDLCYVWSTRKKHKSSVLIKFEVPLWYRGCAKTAVCAA
jgi:hypothetical protein